MTNAFEVRVIQQVGDKTNIVRFVFNQMSAAMEFVETCIECGDDGTVVKIEDIEYKEDR
jgi:selenophosphate synthetase-related protein